VGLFKSQHHQAGIVNGNRLVPIEVIIDEIRAGIRLRLIEAIDDQQDIECRGPTIPIEICIDLHLRWGAHRVVAVLRKVSNLCGRFIRR
jgi:hypothetical protein